MVQGVGLGFWVEESGFFGQRGIFGSYWVGTEAKKSSVGLVGHRILDLGTVVWGEVTMRLGWTCVYLYIYIFTYTYTYTYML